MKRIKQLNDYTDEEIALSVFNRQQDITYSQLALGISNIHRVLFTKNIKKGDRISMTNEETAIWAMKLAAIVTYGAVAVILPNEVTEKERDFIHRQNNVQMSLDEFTDISLFLNEDKLKPVGINIFSFSLRDVIIINYTHDYSGQLKCEATKVYQFSQIAEDIRTRYSSLRHSRIPSTLLANNRCINPTEVLASLSIGAHVTLAGEQPSSGTLLKCLKKCRPHFVYLDSDTAETLIRERIFPMLSLADNSICKGSSLARRNIMKQARKRMMFALGGCILLVNVTKGKFSPDIESFLQRIDFPYQMI